MRACCPRSNRGRSNASRRPRWPSAPPTTATAPTARLARRRRGSRARGSSGTRPGATCWSAISPRRRPRSPPSCARRPPALRPDAERRPTGYSRPVRLHVVDGTYELYRAHFSPRPDHRAPAGGDAKATVGVVSSLLALLHDPDEAVTHLAVAFDNPIRSFRNDLFPFYKSDERALRVLRGFGPRSMPDFLALTGDTADGIPGLTGFGEKGAGLLLGAYEHLENIPAHAHQWKVKPRGALQLASTLAAHRQDALLYRKLATLVETVPLTESLDDLRFQGVPRPEFEAWCDLLGLTTMRAAPQRWRACRGEGR